MSAVLEKPWTVGRFLDWVATQEGRYEFDGTAPVSINGSTARHNRIAIRLITLLEARLAGTAYQLFALEAGLQAGTSVRYPDAMIAGTHQPGAARIITDVRAVFEVLSPTTSRTDRFTKALEYAAVPSILRYALIESRYPGVTLLHRISGSDGWTNQPLTPRDMVAFPELGIHFPVADLYEGLELPDEGGEAG